MKKVNIPNLEIASHFQPFFKIIASEFPESTWSGYKKSQGL